MRLSGRRAAEIDSSYAAYDAHPFDELDEWGDLERFGEAARADDQFRFRSRPAATRRGAGSMPAPMPIDLDHVALAVADVQPHLDALVGELGGNVRSGGGSVGFRAIQVILGDMTIELIQPHATERNDFLARFLDRHGPGPHHLTFKVPDLAAEIERLRSLGYAPTQIDLDNVFWKECFLTPDVAHGTVVQVAQSAEGDPEVMALLEGAVPPWGTQWWRDPPPPAAEPACLRYVALGSPDPEATRAFFGDVLGGTPDGDALAWPGGGRILVEHRPGRPGIDRLVVQGSPERTLAGACLTPT